MNEDIRISDAEWEVMGVLWKHAPRTSQEIIDDLQKRTDWKAQTIRTLLSRLVQKGAVGHSGEGRTFLYHPLVAHAACVKHVSQSFLDRVFEGATNALLLHFVKDRNLSPDDLAELRKFLDETEKGQSK